MNCNWEVRQRIRREGKWMNELTQRLTSRKKENHTLLLMVMVMVMIAIAGGWGGRQICTLDSSCVNCWRLNVDALSFFPRLWRRRTPALASLFPVCVSSGVSLDCTSHCPCQQQKQMDAKSFDQMSLACPSHTAHNLSCTSWPRSFCSALFVYEFASVHSVHYSLASLPLLSWHRPLLSYPSAIVRSRVQ